jgi:hypothetical protein
VQAAVRRAGGPGFGDVQTLSPPGLSAAVPEVGFGDSGQVTALWLAQETQPPFIHLVQAAQAPAGESFGARKRSPIPISTVEFPANSPNPLEFAARRRRAKEFGAAGWLTPAGATGGDPSLATNRRIALAVRDVSKGDAGTAVMAQTYRRP